MIPINLMPFFTQYWPFVLGGVFLYTVIYLSIEKTREEVHREESRQSRKKELFGDKVMGINIQSIDRIEGQR